MSVFSKSLGLRPVLALIVAIRSITSLLGYHFEIP